MPGTGGLARLGNVAVRPPLIHRTQNFIGGHGVFKRTKPVCGGGTISDYPYPFTKYAHWPGRPQDSPWSVRIDMMMQWCGIGFIVVFWTCYCPRYDVNVWCRAEALRRRRERRERQEMDILGIDEHDVDPAMVAEIDRLYIKGRVFHGRSWNTRRLPFDYDDVRLEKARRRAANEPLTSPEDLYSVTRKAPDEIPAYIFKDAGHPGHKPQVEYAGFSGR